jgi:hypothetical protein
MTMANTSTSAAGGISLKLLALGFVAGFIAVPLGHQVMSYIFWLTIPGRAFPWNMAPNPGAFGLPAVVNLSFWGGVWGILWAIVQNFLPRGWISWIVAILFGGICATAFSAYGVTAIKHLPAGSMSWIGFGLNGAWGLVTALVLDLLRRNA